MYERLKILLAEKEMGLEDFANNMGITLSTLRRNMSNNPTVETLQRIAYALNVHITELFEKPIDPDISVTGFVKVDNEIKEIKSFKDLQALVYSIEDKDLLK